MSRRKGKEKACDNTVVHEEGSFKCPNMVMNDQDKGLNRMSVAMTTVVGFFTIMGFIIGGYSFLDQRYALAKNFVMLETRVDVNELRHLYHSALNDMYFLKTQSRKHPDDETLRRKLEEAEVNSRGLKQRIDELLSKKNKRMWYER